MWVSSGGSISGPGWSCAVCPVPRSKSWSWRLGQKQCVGGTRVPLVSHPGSLLGLGLGCWKAALYTSAFSHIRTEHLFHTCHCASTGALRAGTLLKKRSPDSPAPSQ